MRTAKCYVFFGSYLPRGYCAYVTLDWPLSSAGSREYEGVKGGSKRRYLYDHTRLVQRPLWVHPSAAPGD